MASVINQEQRTAAITSAGRDKPFSPDHQGCLHQTNDTD
jgi:hypothetical protein